MKKTIIACAVTGGGDTVKFNPAVPVTPEQIAQSSLEAAAAGAAIVHLHVRDPSTGKPSADPALYRETVERIRATGSDVIINLTTSEGAVVDVTAGVAASTAQVAPPERRFVHVAELRPELCSLDMGTFNLGNAIFFNSVADIRRLAELCRDADVLPEMEVFDEGHIQLATTLLEEGRLHRPPFFQICLGFPGGAQARLESLIHLHRLLTPGSKWAAFATGRDLFPMAAATFALGGHLRVGLEDSIYIDDGVLAPSNAALVKRAAEIVRLLGGTVARANDARRILGLALCS